MPDILKVTTPLPGQESVAKMRPEPQPAETQGVVDPTRVTDANGQDMDPGAQAGKFMPDYESNYEMFLQLLRTAPNSLEAFETVFFSRMGQVVSSGIEAGMAEEIAGFMEMLQMDEPQLAAFVKGQLAGSVKFSGPFFDVLRSVMRANTSPSLQATALDFLKSYDSLASTQHILNELHNGLENIAANMPKTIATDLRCRAEIIARHLPNGGQAATVAQIKAEILPFLASYMSTRHDYGAVRDAITLFVLNLARFEAGSMEKFELSLKELLAYGQLAEKLPGVEPQALLRALVATTRNDNGAALTDKLANIIARGVKGDAGLQSKGLFENILRAVLVNESVYMPLLHAMIPASVAGNMLYSELWVDPDADEGYEKDRYERAVKVLVKFDIKEKGCFEAVLLHRAGGLDIQLFTPPHFAPFFSQIKTAITEITTRNGLTLNSFGHERLDKPNLVSEVFPKLYERRNGINVVV